jgi:FtsH-binding integral membrane protein
LTGAVTLYLDFINLFVMLLQLTGTGVNGSMHVEGYIG